MFLQNHDIKARVIGEEYLKKVFVRRLTKSYEISKNIDHLAHKYWFWQANMLQVGLYNFMVYINVISNSVN